MKCIICGVSPAPIKILIQLGEQTTDVGLGLCLAHLTQSLAGGASPAPQLVQAPQPVPINHTVPQFVQTEFPKPVQQVQPVQQPQPIQVPAQQAQVPADVDKVCSARELLSSVKPVTARGTAAAVENAYDLSALAQQMGNGVDVGKVQIDHTAIRGGKVMIPVATHQLNAMGTTIIRVSGGMNDNDLQRYFKNKADSSMRDQ